MDIPNQNHREQVEYHGIDFWPIEVNTEDIIRSEKMRDALESGKLLTSMVRMGKELKQHAELLAQRCLAACQGRDTGATGEEYAKYIMDTIQAPNLEEKWNSYQK